MSKQANGVIVNVDVVSDGKNKDGNSCPNRKGKLEKNGNHVLNKSNLSPVQITDISSEETIGLQEISTKPRLLVEPSATSNVAKPSGSLLRKDSLSVPGTVQTSPRELAGSSGVRSSPTEALSLQREVSLLSVGSSKSFDQRPNHTSVLLPLDDRPKSVITPQDSLIHSAIPVLPLGPAVVCLIMNILIPGSGTIVGGFCMICCGTSQMAVKEDNIMVSVCVNVWVGAAQLFTVTFLFVGWFWSLVWGIKIVLLAVERRRQAREKRERELQEKAINAFESPIRRRPFIT